jgi:hypothetical protein
VLSVYAAKTVLLIDAVWAAWGEAILTQWAQLQEIVPKQDNSISLSTMTPGKQFRRHD